MTFEQFGIHFDFFLFKIHLDFLLHYYGIILVCGAFVAAYLASLEAQRKGMNPDHVWDGIIWALIAGIIGARLYHILTPPPSMIAQGITTQYYLTHPLEAINTTKGGLGIPGAVAGGLLGLYLFARFGAQVPAPGQFQTKRFLWWRWDEPVMEKVKLDFAAWVDLAAPGLALAQAIGRWGNYVNQELYGGPTSLPWGIAIDAAPGQRYHPAFLYESIGNLLICLALLYLVRRYADWLKGGDLFLLYLIMYPALRFLLEFVRLDSSQIFGLNANQTLMAALVVIAVGVLWSRHRRVRRHELKAQSAR